MDFGLKIAFCIYVVRIHLSQSFFKLVLDAEATPQVIAYRVEQLQFVPQAVSDIRQVLSEPKCTWWDYWEVAQQYEVIQQDYLAELTTEEKEFIDGLKKALLEPATDESTIEDTQQEFSTESSIEAIAEPHIDELTTYQTQAITTVEEVYTDPSTTSLTTDQTDSNSVPEEKVELPTIGLGSVVTHADPYCALYGAKGEVITDLGDEVWVAWEHWKDRGKKTERYSKEELQLWVNS